jgi:polyisoprenoid-binding protein YceI
MTGQKSLVAAALCAMAWLDASAANASYSAVTGASRLEFTGTQAGAEFTGIFREFSASMEFDPDAPERAHIDVQIQVASVDSKDKDRDNIIRGPDIFDTAHFPVAHYITRSIAKSGNGYTASGALTLRGVTKDVAINFQFVPANESAKLIGTAQLKRLDFGAGQGDWKSTGWVADTVRISFDLILNPKH